MKKKVLVGAAAVLAVLVAFVGGWVVGGMSMPFMSPIVATLPQDESSYGTDERAALDASAAFWAAMEASDEAGMRAAADPGCTFVHIGMTCGLDDEIAAYTSGMFAPKSVDVHGRSVDVYGDTAVVITDCDYALNIGSFSTSHHFAVSETYAREAGEWKLVQFSFTALTS